MRSLTYKPLTAEDRHKIEAMIKDGKKTPFISKALGRTYEQIRWELQRCCKKMKNYTAAKAIEIELGIKKNEIIAQRAGMIRKMRAANAGERAKYFISRYTLEERKKIELLLKEHLSFPDISARIGRPRFSVRNEVRKNGGALFYKAEDAQKAAEEAEIRRYSNSPNVAAAKHKQDQIDELKDEISNIKQQIEIILSFVEEKHNKES